MDRYSFKYPPAWDIFPCQMVTASPSCSVVSRRGFPRVLAYFLHGLLHLLLRRCEWARMASAISKEAIGRASERNLGGAARRTILNARW